MNELFIAFVDFGTWNVAKIEAWH